MDGNSVKKARASKGVYEEAVKKENIYSMWQIIKRACKNRRAVFNFSLNLNTNINVTIESHKYVKVKKS